MTENPHFPCVFTPDLYRRSENWALKTRGFENGYWNKQRALIMKVQGKDWSGEDTIISVFLDPAHDYYPVAWKFPAAKQPKFVVSYAITELGTVQNGAVSLPYPKTATLGTTIDAKPNWTRTITIDQASINDMAQNDPRFTLDPKQVDFISEDGKPKIAVAK